MSPETPGWVRDAVFPQVFPDSFAQSERLPRPADLDPIFASAANHRHHTWDHHGVDPLLGGDATAEELPLRRAA